MLANCRSWLACGLIAGLAVAIGAVAVGATDGAVYLSHDPQGQILATQVWEGYEVYVCVYDPDQNIGDVTREKMWAELLIMDPKTGALSVWDTGGYYGLSGDPAFDYLEETAANTGLFVSKRAFRIGTRLNHTIGRFSTHVVDTDRDDFQWGDFLYTHVGGRAIRLALDPAQLVPLGRFENMDTVIVWYRDPNDETDVAVFQAKITDTQSTIEWDQEIYPLTGPGSETVAATLVVRDDDENLNPNEAEYVPVFVLVNPGSWNPVQTNSATDFWMLKNTGGVDLTGQGLNRPVRWHTIYDSGLGAVYPANAQPQALGAYYVQYPTANNVSVFDTDDPNGFARVMFYAQETGIDTGVFQLNLNRVLSDLGFDSFNMRDVLVAYYVDPNDFDDVALDVAYATEKQHSLTSFTNSTRSDVDGYALGQDRLYVQVIDSNANVDPGSPEKALAHVYDLHAEDDGEWLTVTETSSNSPVFFTNVQTLVHATWNGIGPGTIGAIGLGGYQLQLDNFRVEVFNEDTLIVRYNDVYYRSVDLLMLGDGDPETAFPPAIDRIRVANDLSLDTVKIFDTQVFDGNTTAMYFLDRDGNMVSGYTAGDCAFLMVVDPDQNEDPLGRERIDGYWDGGQNLPFGPMALNEFGYGFDPVFENPINRLFGDTNIFNDGSAPKIYILNPRNGRWAAIDLIETGSDTGTFVSVMCIDLVSVYEGTPTFGVLPGDSLIAVYQDPSNHSDVCVIGIKVGIGGGGDPLSATTFTDANGNEVASYTNADDVRVKVVDASHAGAASIAGAVEINGTTFDLYPLAGALPDTFITNPISMADLGVNGGDTIEATYTDPTDPTDVSMDTIGITDLYISGGFTYTLESVNPMADTFTLRFEGRTYTYPQYPVETIEWHWQFQDGTDASGQVVTHTFGGLGEVSNVILETSVGAALTSRQEGVWGLGGLAYSLEDALENGDPTTLQQLQVALSWAGGSVEMIYRACVDASLEVFDLADRYGLTSMNQVTRALAEAMKGPIDLQSLQGLRFVDTLTERWKEAVEPLQAALERLPGLGLLLSGISSKADATEPRELVGAITLPQIYQEAEGIATFVDDLLTNLLPVVSDSSFELQVPTCDGCDPNLYMGLDNGDIAGVLAGIAAAKATLEALLAYTPGDLFMANLEFQLFDDGSLDVQGWDTVESTLWDDFHDARGNGIIDLNGSGDGDASLGHEVLPESCLTLRDGQWLGLAQASLVQAAEWLRFAIQDMPLYPGSHDPQIEWPLEMYWPWSDEPVSVNKTDLLDLIDTFESCLLGPTPINVDIDSDGATDYSTVVNLARLFDASVVDLKDLFPDLVVTTDPDDPLLVIPSGIVDGIDQNWKLDGVLDWDIEQVSINLPDPTLGGILPGGDIDDLLAFLLFGQRNVTCQNRGTVLGAAGWSMVSLPGELCDPCTWTDSEVCGDLVCAFEDDLDLFFAYRYSADLGAYYRVPPSENICYQPGMSTWIYTSEEGTRIDAIVNGTNELVELPLENGWNQIGNPYLFAIGQNALTIRRGGEEKTLLDAQATGWISATLYAYDTLAGGYVEIPPGTGQIPAWTGSWLRTFVDGCTLLLNPFPAPPPPPTATLSGRRLTEKEAAMLEIPSPPPWVPANAQETVASLSVRNMPNPIRSEHTTVFTVQGAGAEHVDEIRVDIHDQNGQRVFTQKIADVELVWHTVNNAGELLANGVYLYQVWVRIGPIWYPMEIRKLAVVR